MTTFDLKVRVNGEATDTLVENDSQPWDCKLGRITTLEGGGSFVAEANHAAVTFDAHIPLYLAPLVRTITIGVEGPHSSPPAWWHDNGDGTAYRILFHGNVVAARASRILQGYITFSAVSQMQGFFERRAHAAALSNTGPRSIAQAIEAAHSLTLSNDTAIPTSSDFYNLDQPKQGPASNGEWLRTAMAGTGCSIVAEWEGTMASPDLCWNTDYPWDDVSTTNYHSAAAGRPWEYEYIDVGMAWRDFVATVEVNGEQGNTLDHAGWVRYSNLRHMGPRPSTRIIDVSNGTRYWGTATLGSSAMRQATGNQTYSVNSWIDTAAECEDAAKWIMRHIGEPSYLKMSRIGFWPDRLLESAAADPDFDPDPEDYAMNHAALIIGDQISSRAYGGAFDNSNGIGGDNVFGFWPDTCDVGSDGYTELDALWNPYISNNGTSSQVELFTVRTIGREWTPSGGWHITVGLEPDQTVAVPDTDHGTY